MNYRKLKKITNYKLGVPLWIILFFFHELSVTPVYNYSFLFSFVHTRITAATVRALNVGLGLQPLTVKIRLQRVYE